MGIQCLGNRWSTSAFTKLGVENLRILIEEHKRQMAYAAQKLRTNSRTGGTSR
jgi:hypothetical protein